MSRNNLLQTTSTVLFVFLLNLQLSNAQSLSIEWGKEQAYHKRGQTSMIDVIKFNEQSILYKVTSTKVTKKNEFIVKHNRNTCENQIFDIVDKTKGYDVLSNQIEFVNGEMQINSEIHHLKTGMVDKYKQLIDTASMKAKNDRVKLLDTDKSIALPTAMLLQNLEMYGDKINLVYKKDKKGNIYSINRKFGNKQDKKKFINSIVSIVCYPPNNGNPISIPLLLSNNCFISSYQLAINEKDEIICTGLYTKEGSQSAIGCYSFVVSPMLSEIKLVDVKAFSNELLIKGLDGKDSQAISDKIANSKEFEDNTMYLSSDIHYNKDGSYNIAIEKYKLELEINQKYMTTINHHYYSDIYVLSCNANGSIRWVQKIPRFCYVIDDASLAGKYYLKYDNNDNMYFIFNLIQSNKIFKTINISKTVCVKLDKDGNEKFTELEPNTEVSKYICPTFFSEFGSNSVIVVKYNYDIFIPGTGSSKNTITFGELKLK